MEYRVPRVLTAIRPDFHTQGKRDQRAPGLAPGGAPYLELRVACDGIGMPARPEAHGGLGLRIMRDRAVIIGARLTIEPAEPAGTVVTCRLVN